MSDYIKREDVIETICKLCREESDECSYPRCRIINRTKSVPSANVVELKRGKWIINGNDAMCSNCNDIFCGDWADVDLIEDCDMNFCPNCGAEMESENTFVRNPQIFPTKGK